MTSRNYDNVIDMDQKKGGTFKRRAEKVSEIVGKSIAITLESKDTWDIVTTVTVVRGLWKWNAKAGLIAGATTLGVIAAVNVVGNVCGNIERINKA